MVLGIEHKLEKEIYFSYADVKQAANQNHFYCKKIYDLI